MKKWMKKYGKRKFLKGISTLVGAAFINFLIGAIFSLCTLAVYEISYIKGNGGSINIDCLTFYYPVEILFQCVSSFISGSVFKQLGLHKTNLLGVTILAFGYYLMYISSSLILDLASMALCGWGTGIIFYPSTINAYEWFKDHNGIVVGIMETMISLGSFFFSFIGEKIINTNEKESNEEDNLYDLEIANKMKKFLLILIICLISAFVLSFFLMFEKIGIKYNILVVEEYVEDNNNVPNEKNNNIEKQVDVKVVANEGEVQNKKEEKKESNDNDNNEKEKINDIEKLNKIKDKNEEIKENDNQSSVISTSGKGTTSNVGTKTQSIMDGKISAISTTKMGTNTTVGTNTQSILGQFDDSNLVFEGKYLNINKKSYKIFREIGKTKNGDLFLINDDENNNLFIVNKIEIKSNEEKNKILNKIKKSNKIDSEYIIKIDKHFIDKENNKEFGYFFIKYYKNNLEKIIELNFLTSRIIWKIFIQLILGLQSFNLNDIL